MSDQKLHIVSLDVPFPADYGGVVDIFYRIKALHEKGYKIILHCFEYGRGEQHVLEEFTEKVIYYPRVKSVLSVLKSTPFIVETRKNKTLLQNLLLDDAPILFEGIHTCYYLNHPRLKNRIKVVRCHNIEQDYYRGLAQKSSGWKKLFFNWEAKKLERYEVILKHATSILAVQELDLNHFKQFSNQTYLLHSSIYLPDLDEKQATKEYGLYHGNLSVSENEEAAIWLIDNVFSLFSHYSFKICGKNPSEKLISKCKNSGIDILPNPSDDEMRSLIDEARLHILYTKQPTGLKLKLLNVLFSSGKIVVNSNMIAGTPFEQFCSVCEDGSSFIKAIEQEMKNELTDSEFDRRTKWVLENLDIRKNCVIIEKIIKNNQDGIDK